MEHKNKREDDQFLITLSDILSLLRRSKKKIILCAVVMGLLFAFFSLNKPILYKAEGTFREKSIKPSNISTSVLQLLSSGGSAGENEAMTMIHSRKLMQEFIEELHLQGNLVALADIDTPLRNIKNNLKVVWASLMNKPKPSLPDLCCPLKIDALNYPGELPLAYKINLQENGKFQVIDLLKSQELVGEGVLGQPFAIEEFSFTLIPTDTKTLLKPQSFIFGVNSLAETAKSLSKSISIKESNDDKNLLELKFEHRNRHQASEILNVVMKTFHKHLIRYHNDISNKQLDYLSLRKDQLTQELNLAMNDHANFLSNDLCGAGFFDTDKEMEFLAKSQHDYKSQLLANELEIKRLENFNPSHLTFYGDQSNAAIINDILGQIRSHKQNRDTLEIEVQKKMSSRDFDIQQAFIKQLDELNQIQQYISQLNAIKQTYLDGNLPDITLAIFNDPRFLLKGWIDRIQSGEINQDEHIKQNFQSYLTNLERLLGVYQRILQERVVHQQNPTEEYKGISLDVATTLYLDYSRKLVEIEGNVRQNSFFIHQMEDPNFEITSLSAGLDDPVSREMIRKASILVLNLRDHNNQSSREQERIQEELDLQRTFLKLHLEQMIHLMKLNKELYEEKVFALQNVSLELINQQVSLLEKNLQDYVKSRLEDLDQERVLIAKHLQNISTELAALPKKWVSQQLIEQEVEINHLIVEEIARLVETKTIAHKLEVIQSSPLDKALPPLYPIQTKFFLWSFIGLILGGFIGAGVSIGSSIAKGIPVSVNSLKLMGYPVAGTLTPSLYIDEERQLAPSNMETLRRLQSFFEHATKAYRSSGKPFLIIEGVGPHYVNELAKFFILKGRRVLIIDLFSPNTHSTDLGLFQYLERKIPSPILIKTDTGDVIPSGGTVPYLAELISTALFHSLIDRYRSEYDDIFIVSSAGACSSEAEALFKLFPCAAVTLRSETSEELSHYAWLMKYQPDDHFCFVVSPE
jgi:uncharacterized protein involved in exopolysaccharide biosynthesis